MVNITKLYGAYNLRFRRWDGEWTVKRLSTQSHSKELTEQIAAAIEGLPLAERTKERTNMIAQQIFDEAHCGVGR